MLKKRKEDQYFTRKKAENDLLMVILPFILKRF